MTYKKLYDELKKTGDLYDMYENMTGNWEQDNANFRMQQEALESLANNTEIYEDEE